MIYSKNLEAYLCTSTERSALTATNAEKGVAYYEVDTKALYVAYEETWYAM